MYARHSFSLDLMTLMRQQPKDVQFFREASDVQFDETGNRKRKHRYGDEDEIEMEQQERKRRQILNREFKNFAEKIAEAASASVRILRCIKPLGWLIESWCRLGIR